MTDPAGAEPNRVRRFHAVVAVPACSEAQRIEACVAALLPELAGGDAAVVVLANNCRDDTAPRARRAAGDAPVFVEEVELAPADAHAGGARRRALDAAAARLSGAGGVLLTTDADSRVTPGWLAANLRALDAGADAVCGVVGFDAAEAAELSFGPERRLEARYATLQAEVTARLDPQAHDPWPNHLWAWGASLAVRADVHHRAGGVPDRPLAEDRAFVERLEEMDARVRRSLEVRVITSARREGRAPGGLSALVDAYSSGGDAPCDAALEPVLHAAARARLRRRLRRAWAGGAVGGLARRLAVDGPALEAILASGTFGLAWRAAEAAHPRLRRRERVTPGRLPREIARAERLLAQLRPSRAGAPDDSARAARAELW